MSCSMPKWPGGVMTRTLDSQLRGSLSGNNYLRQVVHTHVPLSPSSINYHWYWSKGDDVLWLGR